MPGFSPDGLAVFGVTGDRLTIIGHHGHQPGDESPFSHMALDTDYPAAEVVRTGRAVYLSTPEQYKDRYPLTWPLAAHFDRQSWAFLPLTVAGRTMGAWMAAFTYPVAFTPDERSVLTTVARMLAQALSRAEAAESARELTDGLQRSMLPQLGPEIPGMSVAARYVPTGGGLQVGGDWYDMIPLPKGRFALVIGDVQGHDVRAAGLMGQLRIALRAYASEGHRPDAVLSRASRFLHGMTFGSLDEDPSELRFATCLYVEVDPTTGLLDIARAGHPDPAIRMTDGTVLSRPTAGGLPLGIDPDADYPTTRITLEPGETMLICTDGLIETGGHDLETGWKRIRAILEDHDGDLEALADALVQAVHGPSSHHTTGPLTDRREDDIAVLLLTRQGERLRRNGDRAAGGPADHAHGRAGRAGAGRGGPSAAAGAAARLALRGPGGLGGPAPVRDAHQRPGPHRRRRPAPRRGAGRFGGPPDPRRGDGHQRRPAAQAPARGTGVVRTGLDTDRAAGSRVGRGPAGRGQEHLVRALRGGRRRGPGGHGRLGGRR